jgi:hypothetical protein
MSDHYDTGHRGLTAVHEALQANGNNHDEQARPPATRSGFDPHDDPRDPEPTQGPSVLGVEAGRAIALACEVAARDIENTAEQLVAMASEINEEARQIAGALRARGARFQDRIEDFSELAKRVSNTMRATSERVMLEHAPAG